MIDKKAEKRIERVLASLYERRVREIKSEAEWYTSSTERIYGDNPPGEELRWTKIKSFPYYYGKSWTNFWFSSSLSTEELKEKDIYLELKTETDTLLYINGSPEGATNPFHEMLHLTPFINEAGNKLEIKAEAWGGHRFPGYHPSEGGRVLTTVAVKKKDYPLIFSRPRLLEKKKAVWDLYYDVLVLRELSKTLDENSFLYMKIISLLHKSLLSLDFSLDDEKLGTEAERVREEIKPLIEAENGTFSPEILSVGNAHLDHAWLWTISETTRKAARTALNMVNFLSEDDDFRFMFTQPVQMLAVKERYPSIYKKVLKAYLDKKWEPQGTSWVEPDCMLSSGEALIREFIYGLRANRALYPGYSSQVFWIPDSFGYNAQLPQILLGCGMKYFVTSKIGWNDTNAFPYDLFIWEGIDGSRIPAHMIIGAYEGRNNPVEVNETYNKIRHKDLEPVLLRSVGEGDGGGGTTLDDIEEMKRERNLQGLVKNSWSSLEGAMERIFNKETMEKLPVYEGELYLELHRGTYTVQAEIKKTTRELERELHNADLLLSLVFSKEGRSRRYKEAKEKIASAWITLITNLFHDILPGSCIKEAINEAVRDNRKALKEIKEAVSLLEDSDAPLRLFDFNFLERRKGDEGRAYIKGEREAHTSSMTIVFNEYGAIESLKDRKGREYVMEGKAFNTLTLSPDTTVNWDAWDMEYDTLSLRKGIEKPVSFSIEERGRDVVAKAQYRLSDKSTMKEETVIHSGGTRIDFNCDVDWHEEHKILRAEFPSVIRSESAFYGIPFGYIPRSTTENTSMERAQFEVPAHKWVLFKDSSSSLVLSSLSKCGYRVKNGVMSISLLRSAKAPDESADMGRHTFSYSLFIEDGGDEGIKAAIDDGYIVSNPPRRIRISSPLPFSFKRLSGKVMLETVKVSEKEDGIILRFYETLGSEGEIKLDSVYEKTYECDMIEENFTPLIDTSSLSFKPFQVRTILLKREADS